MRSLLLVEFSDDALNFLSLSSHHINEKQCNVETIIRPIIKKRNFSEQMQVCMIQFNKLSQNIATTMHCLLR